MDNHTETIAALATPPGKGGVGIIRISGPRASLVAKEILKQPLHPRLANYLPFVAADDSVIDQGLAIFFPAPNSFTGEDVLEFQGHGGPVVLDTLLQRVLGCDVRLARPGEFSERAFLNGKIDLIQAEAIADLIDCGTKQAAKAAINSLQGAFSKRINRLVEQLIQVRAYIEAAIDFPDEEIDFLSEGTVAEQLKTLASQLYEIQKTAEQGKLLREGMNVVIIGRPNAGKSSLLNQLIGNETAIVTNIPGTTRDVLREQIQINGMPLHIIDTAGLHESPDCIEQEGIRRARQEIDKADHILLVVDSQEMINSKQIKTVPEDFIDVAKSNSLTMIVNKIDITNLPAEINQLSWGTRISVSAKTGAGLDLLRQHLADRMGYDAAFDGAFIARRRHLDALNRANEAIQLGLKHLLTTQTFELVAEECRLAQQALSEITGEYTSDDLLGEIFSSFCIGK